MSKGTNEATKLTYRVYLAGGTHCIRKFDNLDEACQWCWVRDTGKVYRIEYQLEGEERPRRIFP